MNWYPGIYEGKPPGAVEAEVGTNVARDIENSHWNRVAEDEREVEKWRKEQKKREPKPDEFRRQPPPKKIDAPRTMEWYQGVTGF